MGSGDISVTAGVQSITAEGSTVIMAAMAVTAATAATAVTAMAATATVIPKS